MIESGNRGLNAIERKSMNASQKDEIYSPLLKDNEEKKRGLDPTTLKTETGLTPTKEAQVKEDEDKKK